MKLNHKPLNKLRKVLLGATLLTTTVIVSVSPAHADPVTTFIFGAAFASTAAGAVVSWGIGTAVSFAFNWGLSLLKGKPQQQPAVGMSTSTKMGGAAPRSFIVGERVTAGHRIYSGSYGNDGGTPNIFYTDVLALSDIPCGNIIDTYVDGAKVNVDWGGVNTLRGYEVTDASFHKADNGRACQYFIYMDGKNNVAPPVVLTNKFGTAERPWTADMVGEGISYVVASSRYDRDVFKSFPEFKFVVEGINLYDIRKDSSVGGSGLHRWDDPTTWEPSNNPWVQIYNIIRGIYYKGEWVFGGQNISPFRLPFTPWATAMNEADVLIDGVPQYRTSAEIFTDKEPLAVIEEIAKGASGRLAEIGGIYKPLCGMPPASVYSFTDEDVIISKPQDLEPFPGIEDTHNMVYAVYPEPEEGWAEKDAPVRFKQEYIDEDDGFERPVNIALLTVPYKDQVQRITQIMLDESRRFRKHLLSLPPGAGAIEPNDVISWTSQVNGYSAKKFLVNSVDGSSSFIQQMAVTEIDNDDYDGEAIIPLPSSPGTIIRVDTPAQAIADWNAEAVLLQDTNSNNRIPGARMFWTAAEDDLLGIRYEIRRVATGVVVNSGFISEYLSGEYITSESIMPNMQYEARGKYLPVSGRPTDWSAWVPFTTGAIVIPGSDILDGSVVAAKIADAAVTADKLMNEAVTNIKLADQAVSEAKLAVGAVTQDILASGAVIASKLADLAVTQQKIADGAVATSKLANGAVNQSKLADASVSIAKLVAGNTLVEIFTTALPTTNNFEGRTGTFNGKLYRYTGGAWTASVAAADITGTIPIADGSITQAKLADASVTAAKLSNGAVTHDKIAAGSIYGDVIAAGSITARELFLTDFTNLLPEGSFQQGNLDNWIKRFGTLDWGISDRTTATNSLSQSAPSRYSLYMEEVDGQDRMIDFGGLDIPVRSGDEYSISFDYAAFGAHSIVVYMHFWDAEGNYAGNGGGVVVSSPSASGGWLTQTGSFSVPAGATTCYLIQVRRAPTNNVGYAYVTNIQVRKRNNAQLIVDGAIISSKLATNSVVSDKVAANAIIAGKIATNAVTSDTIAANAITSAKVAAGAITAAAIQSGAVLTEKLAVGLGKNLLFNSTFTMGLDGWQLSTAGANQTASVSMSLRNPAPNNWTNPSGYSIQVYQNDATTDGYSDVRISRPDFASSAGLGTTIPCIAGEWYEASVNISAHRCLCQLRIEFRDVNGVVTGYSSADNNDSVMGNNSNPDAWPRLKVRWQAPSNAVGMSIHIRKHPTNAGTNSYMFIWRPFLARSTANATEFMPWSEGGVVLIGPNGIQANAVTTNALAANAVTAAKIAAQSITALEIAAGAIGASEIATNAVIADKIDANAITSAKVAANAIAAGNIQSGAVTTDKLAAGSVTADKVAANSITGDKVVANSITSKQLILADFTNLLPEGSFQTGNLDRWSAGSPWSIYETADGLNPYSQNTPSEYGVFVNFAATQQTLDWTHGFQVRQDDEFSISFDYCTNGTGGGPLVRMHFVDQNGTYNGNIQCYVPNTVATGSTWQRAFGGGKVPARSSRCYLIQIIRDGGGNGYVWLTNVQIRRKNGADMIVAGAITADKLAVNSLSAISANMGTVTAGIIKSTDGKMVINLTQGFISISD